MAGSEGAHDYNICNVVSLWNWVESIPLYNSFDFDDHVNYVIWMPLCLSGSLAGRAWNNE